MTNWKETTIQEIAAPVKAALAMGPFGSNIKSDYFVESGVPVIRGGNLNNEKFYDKDFVFLTEDKADELKSSNAFPGDLVFTHRGTLGQVGIIPENAKYKRYVASQSQMKLTCDRSKVDPLFLFYFFRSPQGQYELLANTSTTGVPAISRPLSTLKAIRVSLPSLSEQKRIAGILGSLDDKIELNWRMNETLEQMARAVFQSWFVDFDPVLDNAAAAGNAVPAELKEKAARRKKQKNKSPLPKEIKNLFPDSFIDSPLGPIPKGWKAKQIGDLCSFEYGKALKAENRSSGNIPVYGSNGQVGWHDEKLVNGPGIVVGRKGNPGIVKWVYSDFFPIDTTFYIVPKEPPKAMQYLYYLLEYANLSGLSADSAVPGLNRNMAYMTSICWASHDAINAFNVQVGNIRNKICQIDTESRTLTQLRETILPKLLTGEIEV